MFSQDTMASHKIGLAGSRTDSGVLERERHERRRHRGTYALITAIGIVLGDGCSSEDPDLKFKSSPAPKPAATAPVTPAPATIPDTPKPEEKEGGTKSSPKSAEMIEQSQAQFQIAFSDDGRYAASGGKNAIVRLFKVEAGTLMRTFAGQNSAVSSITFNRDASAVAAGNINGQMMLWATGMAEGLDETERQSLKSEERRKVAGHIGPVRSLAYRPDGREIASGGEDGTIRYWKLPVLRPTALWVNAGSVVAIEAVPKKQMVLGGTKDGAVDVWEMVDSRTLPLVPANGHAITALACNWDGSFAAAGDSSGKIRLIDLTTRELIADMSIHQAAVTGIKFHPKLPQLVTIGADGKTRITDLQSVTSKSTERELSKITSKGRLLSCSHVGNYAAVAGTNLIEVSDLQNGTLLHSFFIDGADVVSLAWTAKDRAIVAGDSKGRIYSWRMPDGQKLLEAQFHDGAVRAMAGHAQMPEIVSGGADGKIQSWFQPGLPQSITDAAAADATVLSVSPDGKRVAIGTSEGLIQVFNTEERTKINEFAKAGTAIVSLVWSADSEWLAAADGDGSIRMWQVSQGGISLVSLHAGAPLVQLAFHSEGPTLIAATQSGEFRAWKWPFQMKQTLSGHTDAITSILTNRTGTQVMTGAKDRMCRLFDVPTGKQVKVFQGAQSEITCLTKSTEDDWVASGDLDGRISMWTMLTGESTGMVRTGDSPIRGLAVSPSNKVIASASADGIVRTFQLPLPPPVEMQESPLNAILAASSDGRRVAIGRRDGTITIRDTQTGERVQSLSGHVGNITALAWSKDNSCVVSGSEDNTVVLWNSSDGKRIVNWEGHSSPARAVFVSADNEVLTACTAEGRLSKFQRATAQEQERLKPQTGVTAIALSPSGQRLAIVSNNGSVQIVNCETGQVFRKTSPGDAISSVAWLADDIHWVSTGANRKITYWKLDQPDESRGWADAPAGMTNLSVSADGTRVLGNATDGLLRLWDAQGQLLQAFEWPQESKAEGLTLADNGRLIVAAGRDGRTTAFRASVLRVIKAHSAGSLALQFADETQLISAGGDGKVCAWNLNDGSQSRVFIGCPAKPIEMVVAPKTSKLLVLGDDRNLYAWNLVDGISIPLPSGFRDSQLLRMNVREDGSQLALLDRHGTVRIIQMTDMSEVGSIACAIRDTPALTFLSNGSIAYAASKDVIVAGAQMVSIQRETHGGAIAGIAASPKKNEFLTAGTDGLVRVWSIDGKPIRTLLKADISVRSFALSPDGDEVMLLTNDNRVKCWTYAGEKAGEWNVGSKPTKMEYTGKGIRSVVAWTEKQFRLAQSTSGKQTSTLFVPGKIAASAVSPEQSTLYTATDDGQLLRYSLGPTRTVASDQRDVQSLALSANGELVASGGDDATVCVWKTQNLSPQCRLKGHSKGVTAVSFGRDESIVVSASADKTVRIWNSETSKLIVSIPLTNVPQSLSIAPDDRFLIVAMNDKILPTYDLRSGKATESLATAGAPILQALFTQKGLVTLGGDKRICNWDANPIPEVKQKQVAHQTGVTTGLEVLPNGSHFITAGAESGINLFDFNGQGKIEFESSRLPLKSISVSADGTWLAGSCMPGASDNVLTIWNIAERKVTHTISMERSIRSLKFEPEGTTLLVLTDDRKMTRIGAVDGFTLEYLESVADVTISPAVLANREIVTLETDSRARRYLPALQHVQVGHTGAVTCLAYSGDGSVLFSGGADGRIIGWGADREKTLIEYSSGSNSVNEIHVTPDQKSLVATYQDDVVRIWGINGKLTEPDSVFVHKAPVKSARTSTDGLLMVSGGDDKIVHLWMLASGRELAQFHGHDGAIERVMISRDKKSIISFGKEDAIRVWAIPVDALSSATVGQISKSSGRVAVAQPQDSEIETLQRQLAMARSHRANAESGTGKASRGEASANKGNGESASIADNQNEAFKGNADELERRLRVLRSGEADAAPMTEAQKVDDELRQIETQMRTAPPGGLKEKLRLDWRRLKRNKELEEQIAVATGPSLETLRQELASLGSMDPQKIRLSEEENKFIPGIEDKPLQTFKSDYTFDFKSFQPVKLALSHDLKTIAAGRESANLGNDRAVRGVLQLWDVETGVQLRSWREVENHRVGAVVFTPNQQFIYTLPDITIFQISSGMSRQLAGGACAGVNKEGTLIAMGMASSILAEEPILRFLDTDNATFRPQKIDGYESKVTALAFNPGGKSIYIAIRERLRHRLVELDLQTLTQSAAEIEEVRHSAPWHVEKKIPGIEILCISPDEKYLIAYGRYDENDYRLTCWTKQDGKWVIRKGFVNKSDNPLVRGGSPARMWIANDTSTLFVESSKGILLMIDLQTGQSVSRDLVSTHWGMPETARSDDGAWYVSGDDSGRLYVWDLRKQEESYVFRAHSGPIVGVALSVDGSHIISAGEENLIKIWKRRPPAPDATPKQPRTPEPAMKGGRPPSAADANAKSTRSKPTAPPRPRAKN